MEISKWADGGFGRVSRLQESNHKRASAQDDVKKEGTHHDNFFDLTKLQLFDMPYYRGALTG
ncbi:MAG: hypothetical protein EWV76_11535 [Microcystis novacekii Mn_MB_F_20050700_S1]|uniref:Uncharacterized protein n=1 Tax=Microcystis novacekii Mn_MB_F_20050700_S1D TaxID=2486266 RepID=A0A552IH70_9CHRO|nr:MAG: hypothetical protein EWV54_21170 [Microcystis novacekii Mn_MB_F_20050700_S1D]TRU87034.1 MAG: hypothetical protein EWV76_11535 [Microcystis novacekii Mn_MB_F_20050700_S1]